MNYNMEPFGGKFLSLDDILLDKEQVERQIFNFPAGEFHIKVLDTATVSLYTIATRFKNNGSIVCALLAADALRRFAPRSEINLFLPYLPYSRQDRKMVNGEPFSLKVMAKLLETGGFNTIYTLDAHSDVASAVIDNLVNLSPAQYIRQIPDVLNYTWIAPDAGAAKRIYKIAAEVGYKGEIVVANKVRDVATGKIIRTSIDGDVKDKKLLCVDDICSYGGTFRHLAQVVMKHGAADFKLYVSHYEGVADVSDMAASGISEVFTTKSIERPAVDYVKEFALIFDEYY